MKKSVTIFLDLLYFLAGTLLLPLALFLHWWRRHSQSWRVE